MRRVFTTVVALFLIVGTFTLAHADNPNPHCGDRDVPAGTTVIVKADCRVHGDVFVGKPGTASFKLSPDSDPETGMAVVCNTPCRVFFPFGGGITGQLLDSIVKNQALNGCDNGCSHGTNVLMWPQSSWK